MALRRVRDLPMPGPRCTSRDHNPPLHISLSPGVYEWECPRCGDKTVFEVGPLWCDESPGSPSWVRGALLHVRRTYRELRVRGVTREHARADLVGPYEHIARQEAAYAAMKGGAECPTT